MAGQDVPLDVVQSRVQPLRLSGQLSRKWRLT
jgi:hypothetical protein